MQSDLGSQVSSALRLNPFSNFLCISSVVLLQWESSSRGARNPGDRYDTTSYLPQPRYAGLASSVSSPRAKLPEDLRASLESRLSDSHQERVHQLAERLRSNIDLDSDEILAALKHSPLTASHAEARTTELLNDVMAAEQQVSLRRHSEQLAQKDASLSSLEQQLDATRQQLYAAQAAQQTLRDRAGHATSESAQLQVQLDSLKSEVERLRKEASEAHTARMESDKALAAAESGRSASQLSLQAKIDELEQSRSGVPVAYCLRPSAAMLHGACDRSQALLITTMHHPDVGCKTMQ